MPQLKYIGKTIDEVGIVPLPEGWSACDHEETDPAVLKAKLASGNYERVKAEPADKEKE